MSFTLRHQTFHLKRIIADNNSESVTQGTFSLPDEFPEIGRGLHLRAFPASNSTEVRDGRVIFEGALDVEFLYSHFSEREPEPVVDEREGLPDDDEDVYGGETDNEFANDYTSEQIVIDEVLYVARGERAIPFAYALELPGVEEDMPVTANVTVVTTSFEVRPDRASIDVDVVLAFESGASVIEPVTIATGFEGNDRIEVETDVVHLASLLGTGESDLSLSGELELIGETPAERLLWMDARADVLQSIVTDGCVSVTGVVDYKGLIVGEGGTKVQSVSWPAGLSFDAEVSVPGATANAEARVKVLPGRSVVHIKDTEEGASLSVQTPLAIQVVVERAGDIGIVKNLHSESAEIAIRRKETAVIERVGDQTQTDVSEKTLELDAGLPPIEQIVFGTARAIIDDVHVLGDRVAVEMRADIDILYVGRADDGGTLHNASWPGAITLDVELPIQGAEPGLDRTVRATVTDVDFDLLNRENVEVRLKVDTTATLSRDLTIDFVDDAVEVPVADADLPTYTYVVIRPGDTVWRLASMYRSDPDLILRANGLQSEADDLDVGRKLCVPRASYIHDV